ncbi:RNA polymerase sigma factor, sigma-70 family [Catalinimonas alkaloidigena]|uniref:RNA polymerase sigma factor, sigma-70 family n=1 Tax=Catalinimonas alkaloidigena TaxID=1075417 RepID=A0A1G9AG17_9BACT|nr:sigma-70 family RNA polymerase sigma factor [Catalinimonas alkaloidigena]SDK26287.1 RNA polymerase sigma factor, sigma-70 family [Catalinimonas alkaloidigena]
MKDREVLERIKSGDESALDYLYRKHYRMMVRLVTNNSGSEDEAKDIFQDALIVFWQKAHDPTFELTSKISTFLYSVCLNLWRKELDRKLRMSGEMREGADHAHEDLERRERIEIITRSIESLGETCRKVLTYHYFDRLSMQDIADRLGFANADTAKSKKYKCKKELDRIVKAQFKATDFLD